MDILPWIDSLPWVNGRPPELWLVGLMVAIAQGILFCGVLNLRHTTLVSSACWGAVAAVTLVCAAVLTAGKGMWVYEQTGTYLPSVALVAPTLAMLGAKRPQNGAWQFIVITLIVVLSLPLLQSWSMGEKACHVPTLFRWLIVVHIVVGVVNYLPTRFAMPAILFGAAQCAVAEVLLEREFWNRSNGVTMAALGLAAALIWLSIAACRSEGSTRGLDRVWRDFRDMYGLVWGLRIAERLNTSALKHRWPVEFTWGGMLLRDGVSELDAETKHRVERELRSHLRRFVSHDWIARRLHDEPRA